jgi:hypothetical protein
MRSLLRRACLGLLGCWALASAGVARAEETAAPAAQHHLVRIGPQALVFEDARGNVSMVDEVQPDLTRGQAIGITLGAFGGGTAAVIINEPRAIAIGAAYSAEQPTRGGIVRFTQPVSTPDPTVIAPADAATRPAGRTAPAP